MRMLVVTSVLLLISAPASGQKASTANALPKKGDTITVTGCLTGGALQATDVSSSADSRFDLAGGLTFRLTGDKKLLKQLRDDYGSKVVQVRGVLKSNLPQDISDSRTLGGMRVTIGAIPTPNSPDAEARRSLPVLEAKSFDGGTVSCGR
jgi:hypothetical protein